MLSSTIAFLLLGASQGVDFSIDALHAKQVSIAGDFNAWGSLIPLERVGSRWKKSFALPPDARIEYKFVVDGNWILDPANPHHMNNGVGGENSVWTGPDYRFSIHDQLPRLPMKRSELTVGGRTIVVFSPSDSKGLPVLVYGDGPSYENPGKVQNVLENLVEAGKASPAVVVLIPPIDRMKEYGTDWKAYGEYVFGQVLPAVRSATGASAQASDTYMGGSSMGGLISLRLAEEFPNQLAGGIHCQSSAIQWTALKLNNEEVSRPAALSRIASGCRIWLDWGTFEDALTTANVSLTKTLRKMGRPFASKTTPEGHTWTAWRNRMESGLTYLLPPKR